MKFRNAGAGGKAMVFIMWTCPECKTQNIDDTKICLSCGKGRICRKCMNPTSGDKCEHCSEPYTKTPWLTETEYEKVKLQKNKDAASKKQTVEKPEKQKGTDKTVSVDSSVKDAIRLEAAKREAEKANKGKTDVSAIVQPKDMVKADAPTGEKTDVTEKKSSEPAVSKGTSDVAEVKKDKPPVPVKPSSGKGGKIAAIVAVLLVVAAACACAGYYYVYLPQKERSEKPDNILTEIFDPVKSSAENEETPSDALSASDAIAMSDALMQSDGVAGSDAQVSSDSQVNSAGSVSAPITVPQKGGNQPTVVPGQTDVPVNGTNPQTSVVVPQTPSVPQAPSVTTAEPSKPKPVVDANASAYNTAKSNLKNKRFFKAYNEFKKLGSYSDSRQQLGNVAYEVAKYLSAGHDHSAVSRLNGTVSACGSNEHGKGSINEWVNITGISVNGNHSVGVRKDGTMIASGSNEYGQCDVSVFKNIKEVSAGMHHTLALTKAGTAVAIGNNVSGQCNVYLKSWSNLKSVSAGGQHSVALKKDGTVLAVGNNDYGQCNVSGWRDIVQVSAGTWYTLGLKKDGTVLFAGQNDHGQANVSSWRDVVYVSAGMWHCLGVKADGTVVAAGNNDYGQCNVSSWKNIVSLDAGGYGYSLAINSNGKVLAAGDNSMGQSLATEFAIVAQ